jgi:L,D-peptidoglycan transpeptidase YkuD (ErfK/YbiS/YcfS/YnhG family)
VFFYPFYTAMMFFAFPRLILSGGLLWIVMSGSLLADSPLQLVVATAPDANSHRGDLRLFVRKDPQSPWQANGDFSPTLLGRNGLAWGIGVHPPQPGLQKIEHDGRSPAGIFKIGLIMGSDPTLPAGSAWNQYHQITANDAWPDDPTVPEYNHLFTLQPGQPVPDWFKKHRMRLNDAAYHWLVVIEHNYPKAIPGMGSAIFFHIRRGEDVPSSGCTVMEPNVLEKIIIWLVPSAHPEFVLLTRTDYQHFWKAWDLPPPELAIP